jgi:hypothetical protein
MTKIRELIDIHSGYAQYVNLIQTFEDPTQNRERMAHYMPIQSHREAFTRLARALYPLDNRAYFLTGSYGTGKSHLCLMMANYMTLRPDEPEMVGFFDNWHQRDPDGAERLRNLRGEGRYLVALGDFGLPDFETMILRALQNAIEREQLQTAWLDTHYQEAVRQIETWESREQSGGPSGTLQDFRTQLVARHPDQDLNRLKDNLAKLDPEALSTFRELYRTVVGREFSYSKDNLISILSDFMSNPEFKTRYKGLVFIADEFGYMLDRGNIDISRFQSFAEMCQNGVEGSTLVFIGTGHKPFPAYAAGGLTSSDFRVVAARLAEVALESAELELIIAAIVDPDKDHPVWRSTVAKQASLFNRFALTASRLGIFKHLKGPELRTRIVEDIYPMHPMATHCLIQMSTEIGSNARSVFRFFSSDVESEAVEGSYRAYIENTQVRSHDRLSLYTADGLVTYFQSELSADRIEAREAVRGHVRNYRASLQMVRKQAQAKLLTDVDPMVERILRLILVYEISRVASTFENIAFGLYCESPAAKSQLQNRLAELGNQRILIQSSTGIYELHPAGEGFNFGALIEQYKADPNNIISDLPGELAKLVSLGRGGQWLEARNHNQPYGEDKRLLRVFAQPGDLAAEYEWKPTGERLDFFTRQKRQMQSTTQWRDRYEGVAVYVLCETEDDVARARQAAEANPHPCVIVGIPRQPIPIRNTVMNLRAALHIQQAEDMTAMSLHDRTRLQQDIIGDERQKTGLIGEFIQARDRYLSASELTSYGQAGKVLVVQPKTQYEPADEAMGRLYTKRNTVPQTYLNQIHVARFGPGKDVPLNDTIARLLSPRRSIEIDHSAPANRGETRYLRRVLAENGALRHTGETEGNIAFYRVETTPDKFRQKLPALADLLDTLCGIESGQSIPVRDLVQEYVDDPYGQGPVALSLYLAFAFRTFGDELRLQTQPGGIGYVTVNDPDLIVRLVDNAYPNAVLERQPISEAAHSLIDALHNLFAAEPGAAGQRHTVSDAYRALQDWWDRQPNLARILDIYGSDTSTGALVNLLLNMHNVNPYRFVLEQIQTVYGYPDDAVITGASQEAILGDIGQDKLEIERAARRVKEDLLERLMAPFEPQSRFYDDYKAAIETWYKSLGPEQQDEYAEWHSQASRAVVQRLRTIINIEDTFWDLLPASPGFGLGKADDWHRDRSDEYVQMFRDALERVEANRVKVPLPGWMIKGKRRVEKASRTQAQVFFRGQVTLQIEVPEPGIEVMVTDNDKDPRSALQRLCVKDQYDLTVKNSRNVKLVSQGLDGSYGQVVILSFVNEDRKYEVSPLAQPGLFEREYKFVYPKDAEALRVLLSSILLEVIHNELITEDQARQLLTELADHLKEMY